MSFLNRFFCLCSRYTLARTYKDILNSTHIESGLYYSSTHSTMSAPNVEKTCAHRVHRKLLYRNGNPLIEPVYAQQQLNSMQSKRYNKRERIFYSSKCYRKWLSIVYTYIYIFFLNRVEICFYSNLYFLLRAGKKIPPISR